MKKGIPFTQIHEDLLFSMAKKQGKDSQEIHRLGVMMEHLTSNMDAILEVVTRTEESWQRQGAMEAKIENHEHRISAVESSVKTLNRLERS